MIPGNKGCPQDWFEFLEGVLEKNRQQALQEHLESCSKCRVALERDRQLLGELRQSDVKLDSMDLVPELVRRLSGKARPVRRHQRVFRLAIAGAGVVCLTLVAVLWLSRISEYRSKGGRAEDADRWVGVSTWVIDPNGKSQRVEGRIGTKSKLAFGYTNLGTHPFEYLMIFAVDSRGKIHWFYPAYLKTKENPQSLPISAGVQDKELPEEIEFQPAPGRLRLIGLFTRRPLRVKQLEAWVNKWLAEASFWTSERLPVPSSGQQIIDLEVRR